MFEKCLFYWWEICNKSNVQTILNKQYETDSADEINLLDWLRCGRFLDVPFGCHTELFTYEVHARGLHHRL